MFLSIYFIENNISKNIIPSPNKEQIINQVEQLTKKYNKKYTDSKIIDKEELQRFDKKNIYEFSQQMKPEDSVLYIYGVAGWNNDINIPNEIYATFDALLYLYNIKSPCNISAVVYHYNYSTIDLSKDFWIIISKLEFEKLYNETDITGLSRNQAIQVLSNKWIDQVDYIRNRSDNPEKWDQQLEEEYRWKNELNKRQENKKIIFMIKLMSNI